MSIGKTTSPNTPNIPYIICTSSTRPGTPAEGTMIYETNTDLTYQYTGSAWQQIMSITSYGTYTPSFASTGGGASLGTTGTAAGRYTRMGRYINGLAVFTFGGTSPGGGSGFYIFGLPVAASSSWPAFGAVGSAFVYDNDVGGGLPGYVTGTAILTGAGGSTLYIAVGDGSASAQQLVFSANPFTFNAGSQVHINFNYEANS